MQFATLDPGECDAMLINAGVTHPSPLWLDRLSDGGRLVVPLTMATTPTIGFGVMARIVREGDRFLADMVTPVAIYSCTGMRYPQREPPNKGGHDQWQADEVEIGAPRRARSV